jgi:hypothetical protein
LRDVQNKDQKVQTEREKGFRNSRDIDRRVLKIWSRNRPRDFISDTDKEEEKQEEEEERWRSKWR